MPIFSGRTLLSALFSVCTAALVPAVHAADAPYPSKPITIVYPYAGGSASDALTRQIGEIISKASVNKEEILITPVDLAQVDQTRTHWPFLRDRRIDAYGDITKRLID